jgi:DNA-binding phage protein
MPRYAQPSELTPFAQVLIDYMWNRRRPTQAPLGVTQLADKLGMPRQNVNNWIYRGTVPTFEVVLAVLVRLDIPLRQLYDAYQRTGLPVPRWDEDDTASEASASGGNPAISRSRKATTLAMNPDSEPHDKTEMEK